MQNKDSDTNLWHICCFIGLFFLFLVLMVGFIAEPEQTYKFYYTLTTPSGKIHNRFSIVSRETPRLYPARDGFILKGDQQSILIPSGWLVEHYKTEDLNIEKLECR